VASEVTPGLLDAGAVEDVFEPKFRRDGRGGGDEREHDLKVILRVERDAVVLSWCPIAAVTATPPDELRARPDFDPELAIAAAGALRLRRHVSTGIGDRVECRQVPD
jgi:hypothetical protein